MSENDPRKEGQMNEYSSRGSSGIEGSGVFRNFFFGLSLAGARRVEGGTDLHTSGRCDQIADITRLPRRKDSWPPQSRENSGAGFTRLYLARHMPVHQ